jgi:hypothetical protein
MLELTGVFGTESGLSTSFGFKNYTNRAISNQNGQICCIPFNHLLIRETMDYGAAAANQAQKPVDASVLRGFERLAAARVTSDLLLWNQKSGKFLDEVIAGTRKISVDFGLVKNASEATLLSTVPTFSFAKPVLSICTKAYWLWKP